MISVETNLSGDALEGLDKFERKIKEKVVFSGVAAAARVIYDELLITTSPPRMGRVSGNLHEAAYWAFSPERSDSDTKVYHVSVNKRKAPHWHLLEFGTSRMAAKPFLRPAADHMPRAINKGKERMTRVMTQGEFV